MGTDFRASRMKKSPRCRFAADDVLSMRLRHCRSLASEFWVLAGRAEVNYQTVCDQLR